MKRKKKGVKREEKGRGRGKRERREKERERERRGSVEPRDCNFQELTYLTTVNMGTLHTHNAYPLFILRSRRNFFHRERESSEGPSVSGTPWCARLALPPPAAAAAARSSLLPCIRFNQNATSVGRARSSGSGTSLVARRHIARSRRHATIYGARPAKSSDSY